MKYKFCMLNQFYVLFATAFLKCWGCTQNDLRLGQILEVQARIPVVILV
jgi:hypothetical protein